MEKFKVTIYPKTTWHVTVEADTEEEAKDKALSMEGPAELAYHGDYSYEWTHEILEWPNIGNGTVDVEEVEE